MKTTQVRSPIEYVKGDDTVTWKAVIPQ